MKSISQFTFFSLCRHKPKIYSELAWADNIYLRTLLSVHHHHWSFFQANFKLCIYWKWEMCNHKLATTTMSTVEYDCEVWRLIWMWKKFNLLLIKIQIKSLWHQCVDRKSQLKAINVFFIRQKKNSTTLFWLSIYMIKYYIFFFVTKMIENKRREWRKNTMHLVGCKSDS
jgi:hypothetical protein